MFLLASLLESTGAGKGVIVSSHPSKWGGIAGMLGGLLWVLFPLGALPVASLLLTPRAALAFYGLWYLLPQLLMLIGLQVLHALHRRRYGWLGTVGFYLSFFALVLTFIGGTFEMIKMASTSTGSTLAYLTVIMSFFILVWGSTLLGLAIIGTLHDPPRFLGGMLLSIAVPLGFLFVFMAGGAWDFGFWAGLTVPYGVAWLLLGYAMLRARSTVVQRPPTSAQYSLRRTIRRRSMLRG